MTKRDYIRDLWRIYCQVYKIDNEDPDVYFCNGHWYGQCRKIIARGNCYTTQLTEKWAITYRSDPSEYVFSARRLKIYN